MSDNTSQTEVSTDHPIPTASTPHRQVQLIIAARSVSLSPKVKNLGT